MAQNTMPISRVTMLEHGQLPLLELAEFASESRRPRPIYTAHKWFAPPSRLRVSLPPGSGRN